jgi:hypothetical protein
MGRFIALTTLLVALAGLVTAGPAFAAFPGGNGKIAYEAVSGTDTEIFVMNANGSGQTNVSNDSRPDFDPAWSPTGQQIAFARVNGGHRNIWVMNADGTGQVELTPGTTAGNSGLAPTWSPNGAKIAYQHETSGIIWVMDVMDAATGAGKTPLDFGAGNEIMPAWSPDGTKLAFVRNSNIWVGDAGGDTTSTELTTMAGSEVDPDWSPNGSKITFGGPVGEAWVMNADGSGQTNLTAEAGGGELPAWSPDGTKIVFHSSDFDTGGGDDIFTMKSNGTAVTPLNTALSTDDQDPDWQPAVPAGYPRPQAGAQFRVPLVIAYRPCGGDTTPNRTHGPALTADSCNPANESSKQVTVGTLDAEGNGFTSQSAGFLKMTMCASGTTATGVCSTPPGMSAPDVRIQASITDVRCRPDRSAYQGCEGLELSDYVGELQGVLTLRITDKHNSSVTGATADAATVSDLAFPFTVPCTANPAGGNPEIVGATCAVLTSANAVTPGSVLAGKRANTELRAVEVFDGGSDGDVDTPGNILFERQGIFIP